MGRLLLAGAAAMTMGLAACGGGETDGNGQAVLEEQDFGAFARAEGLSTAASLVERAQLREVLEGPGSYTFFAPSDEAFAALPADQRQALESEEGQPQLVALIRQHMAPGYFTSQDIAKAAQMQNGEVELASLGAAPIQAQESDGAIVLGSGEAAARVVGAPIRVENSLVYRIDRLLPPPPAE